MSLADLLSHWARRINLTGHRSPEAILRSLIADAAALSNVLPEVDTLADLGSGAGFPGLPLAILRPRCQVLLVEARLRRHHFQRAALRDLALANVEALLGRAEATPAVPAHAVVAQAVASPEQVLPWMLRWVRPGGLLLLPGSARPGPIPPHPEVRFLARPRYRLPLGGPERSVWIGRRLP